MIDDNEQEVKMIKKLIESMNNNYLNNNNKINKYEYKKTFDLI